MDFFLRLKNTKKQRFHGILVNDVEHQKIHGMASDDSWQVQPEICHNMSGPLATLCYAMLRYAAHRTQERSNMVQSICRVMDGRLVILLDPGAMTCDDKLNRWVF